jgi:hypothetical protein
MTPNNPPERRLSPCIERHAKPSASLFKTAAEHLNAQNIFDPAIEESPGLDEVLRLIIEPVKIGGGHDTR